MTDVSIVLALAAGALSFVSPCVLALLPVYLAFLGTAVVEGGGSGTATKRVAVLPQALLFVVGFSALFIMVGTTLGVLGAPLFRNVPAARQVAGIAVMVLGLVTTGLFGPLLDRMRIGIDASWLPTARSGRSLALGVLVGIGWTPCIGPVLGAITIMAASQSQVRGALLMLCYALGLGVPFLLVGLGAQFLTRTTSWLRRHYEAIAIASGGVLVVLGWLVATGRFTRMIAPLVRFTPNL
jgi:cytochrome c-type biogenesis protein